MTVLICVAIGSAMGLLSGLLGVGGGIIAIPAMIYFLGMDPKAAMATSLVIIIPVSLSGAITHLIAGKIDLKVVAAIAVGGVVFAFLGARIHQQDWMNENYLKKGFAIFLLCISLKMLLEKPKAPEKGETETRAVAAQAKS